MDPAPSQGTVTLFQTGESLIRENEISRKLFIIKRGKARVFKTYLGRKITLAVLGEGEVFGELSFFDAEPRSASVEALTEIQVRIIDGEQAQTEIKNLPPWIFPLFKTVFHRFRKIDQRLTVLQSMHEFQKKAFKTDQVGKTIYLEVLRFLKVFLSEHEHRMLKFQKVEAASLYTAMDDVLGNRVIGLRAFWQELKEHDLINNQRAEAFNEVELRAPEIEAFKQYLESEVDCDRYMLLSHSAIAILGRIVGYFDHGHPHAAGAGEAKLSLTVVQPETVALHREALQELFATSMLRLEHSDLVFNYEEILKTYVYQKMLKSFDHTMMNVE